MASIEIKGTSVRVVWRYLGKKQYTSWPSEQLALKAKRLVESRRGQISDVEVYSKITGVAVPLVEGEVAGPTLRDWIDTWLGSKTRIQPSTVLTYRRQFEKRIFPFEVLVDGEKQELGDVPLRKITGSHVGEMLNNLNMQGLKPSTLTRYYSALHAALTFAVLEKQVDDNAARRTDFVRDLVAHDDDSDDGDGHVYLTPEEFKLIVKCSKPDARPLLEFLAGSGTRFSEAIALAVGDVEVGKNGTLRARIRRAFKHNGKGAFYLGTTKGRGRRTITLGRRASRAIEPLLSDRPADALVFTGPHGGVMSYHNFRARRWDPAVAAAMRCAVHPPTLPEKGKSGPARKLRNDEVSACDCPGVLRRRPTPHDLRHSHVAWLTDAGRSAIMISRRLGHNSTKITESTYGGILTSTDDASADALDGTLDEDDGQEIEGV